MIQTEIVRTFRRLFAAPRFSLSVIVSIAIAIGPVLVAFSIFEASFLREMTVKNSQELFTIHTTRKIGKAAQVVSQGVSYPDFQDLQAAFPQDSWRQMAAWKVKDVTRSSANGAQPLRFAAITSNYFSIANTRFIQGYAPTENEIGVVVSAALWRELSAGRQSAELTIYDRSYPIVGVVDESFHGLYPNDGIDAWVPINVLPAIDGDANLLSYREMQDLSVIVRARNESAAQSARPLLATISARLSEFHEGRRYGWHFAMEHARPTFLEMVRTSSGAASFAPLLVVICVLLIAATNVANLFVIRATSREREMQLRLALGIQRKHLLLYQCLEPIVLGLIGLALGLWIGLLGVRRLSIHPALQFLHIESSIASIIVSCCAALLFMALCVIIPLLRTSGLREAGVIHQGNGITAHGVSRLQRSFLVLQFTLALAFTCISVQLASAVRQQNAVDVGFNTRNLLVVKGARIPLGGSPEKMADDYRRVVASVSSLPGVIAVSASLSEFFGGYGMMKRPVTTSPASDWIWEGGASAAMDAIGPGYFAALGLPMTAGREFGAEERIGTQGHVIINQALAKLLAPKGNALGMTIYELGKNPLEVVGIVPNVRTTVSEQVQPVYYRSLSQSPLPSFILYARVAAFSPALTAAINKSVVQELPESGGRLSVYVAEAQRAQRDMPATALFWLATGLSAIAMLVSGLGLYGVASHATLSRSKEFGIRAAMGATPGQLAMSVFGNGLGWTALATTISLPFVWVGMRVTSALVVGVRQIPVSATAAVIAAYLLVVFAALLLPALRASSVNPSSALRASY